MNKLLFFFTIGILTLSGCSASRMSFNVMAPANKVIPKEIQTLAIIDRSVPENEDLNKIEGILTGEGLEQDKLSTQFVLDGLRESLSTSSRYNVIRTTEIMKGSGSGFLFPTPLPWEKVEQLCEKYDADAIVSLETYDSDFIISKDILSLTDLRVNGTASVNCGFRMYFPSEKSIIDEFHFSHKQSGEIDARSIRAVIGTLITKNAVIHDASFTAGMIYGERITPSWYRVSRDYFKKSKGDYDFEEGARMMELNDWDKATAALEKALESNKMKTRGRAAHNLAVVNEILGDLPAAKEWTTVAWGKYKEKKSKDYGYILTRRIQDQKALEYQLEKNEGDQ
ncbi:MAG: tetratricopeptide repeat protein [Bacteroidales bacterium]|nr:tetratricopeptide repeat protein [Bacteroidales bacterium]